MHIRDRAAASPAIVKAATIPIEHSAARLLLLSVCANAVWYSTAMSRGIVARRRAASRATEWLDFPATGHFICGTGDQPTRDAAGGDSAQAGGTADAAGTANS
ncbi:acyl-CoA thioester hydrolase/BAAT C-terminal domain-containing protein [Sphingomonas psychrolutea]|uniref:Uncharacterized protein n=1 Tax=Sphingomonas psychrolutea TaxID=1259676 RepID=A0ABQ1H691_9SPHN|nr:acyl-CoA thioester hydrolase/BAAT C-terminal domain-containing protein [Sphingomonas psychrolutea]GGA60451.1 hypothetical protein GCM10011395_33550 [Sphingomonas psychrolutea]